MTQSINHLYKQAGEGDNQAFQQLVQLVGNKLYHIAISLCKGDSAMAEDALQNALIKLWQSAPNWREKSPFIKYASTIVYTCCMDMYRARKTHDNIDDHVVLSFPKAEKDLQKKAQRKALTEKLRSLPQRQRDAILLSFYFEQSQKDVALALGTTEKAVESLLMRAKKTLKTSFTEEDKEAIS